MKNLILLTFLVLPTLAFAGGMGVDMSDYNITPAKPDSALNDSSEAPQVQAPVQRTARRGGLQNRRSNYWDWVTEYRAAKGIDGGITRGTTSYRNYGDQYDLSNGLEPIDANDNTFRGISREDERQAAAQRKLMKLRGLR